MGSRMSGVTRFGIAAALVLLAALVMWRSRRWTNHDVSDPGVTL